MNYLKTRYQNVHQSNDAFYNLKARQLMKLVLRSGTSQPQSILDLGSACGDLLHALNRGYGMQIAGIESDPAMVETAKKRGGEFVVSEASQPAAAFRGKFDLVSSFELFEHLTYEDHEKIFSLYKY